MCFRTSQARVFLCRVLTFLRHLFFLFFAEDFSACAASESAPVVSGSQPSASRVRFRLVMSCPVPVPSSEVAYPGSCPLASGVFSRPTTRLLPRPLLGPQSLPSDSGFHQRRSVVSFGSHMFVHSHHRFPSALMERTSLCPAFPGPVSDAEGSVY